MACVFILKLELGVSKGKNMTLGNLASIYLLIVACYSKTIIILSLRVLARGHIILLSLGIKNTPGTSAITLITCFHFFDSHTYIQNEITAMATPITHVAALM